MSIRRATRSVFPGYALTANVANPGGDETILASFAHGVMVYGREGQLLASTPGFSCEGSADELDVLAVGTAFGVPMVAIVAKTGGRREQLTWLGLFRVGANGRLEATFAGAVEQREDGIVRRGAIRWGVSPSGPSTGSAASTSRVAA